MAETMEQIRTWLDHERIQPSVFQLSLIPGGTIFHLEFNAVSEAEAFTRAFAREVIPGERDAGNVAACLGPAGALCRGLCESGSQARSCRRCPGQWRYC